MKKLMYLATIVAFIVACAWTFEQLALAAQLVKINSGAIKMTPELAENYSRIAGSGINSVLGLLAMLLLGTASIEALPKLLKR